MKDGPRTYLNPGEEKIAEIKKMQTEESKKREEFEEKLLKAIDSPPGATKRHAQIILGYLQYHQMTETTKKSKEQEITLGKRIKY